MFLAQQKANREEQLHVEELLKTTHLADADGSEPFREIDEHGCYDNKRR